MSSTPRRRPRLAVGCALAVLACALAGPAFADPAPSYTDLLARLDQTPAAAESGALVDAAEARVRQARVRPNPTLSLTGENLGGSGPYSGVDAADLSLSFSQALELWGRRPARVNVARAEAGAIARLGACGPRWCRLTADGVKGWAPKEALWGVDPDEIRD